MSDVIVPPGRDGVIQCVEELCQHLRYVFNKKFVVICQHDDHVHVAHVCKQTTNSCRCSWLVISKNFRRYKRRNIRRRVYACDFDAADWSDIVGYFCTNGHIAEEVFCDGADVRLCSEIRNFSKNQNSVSSQKGMVEACIHQGPGDLCGTKSAYRRNDAGGRGHIGARKLPSKSQNGVHQQPNVPMTFEDLFKYFPTCPPDAFVNIKEFYLNPILNKYDENDKLVRITLRNWCTIIRDWDIFDFNTYYNTTGVSPYFNAYSRSSNNLYFTVEKSLDIANELLNFQFQNNATEIYNFLNTLYCVLDKKIPKLNSICIYSPPSAGKNFFFDAVASYFLNYGMFGTANKNNNFTWADGAGKRLVIWNEPNYEQHHIEKMKELLGGDTTRVHVKYKGDQPLQGPPIILLTNNYLSICNDSLFTDRLRTYRWEAAPFLKDYARKLNPLFFFKLLVQWKIVVDNIVIL
ncbi:Helicase, superfamily 3, DNA virus,P-loop containing nucleoside triphosphate hydrolase,Parvovirus [Cinara cedri]|uniref:Helicase, superfamily 3, DNA virus,P-loop containing nucleoside triphosphate hydrolase,Parvovirus n=1 Tax=Cinara cedri TaxID=506608 RepID=A0A5E4M7U2_9HEMI|nr:Helicase, superfamily 3, DNA virus,P-loop containing nucleoside triphosphate hydrolase,Parvovirus [Cinara cedri]